MNRLFAALILTTALTAASPLVMAADGAALKRAAVAYIDSQTAVLEKANRDIWSYAEVGLDEHKSSQELQGLLAAEGFKVEAGVAGMPTAFVATYGSGGPVIGILAEFDALIGVSQSDSTSAEPGPNPLAGHACGHSIFGVGSVGAALAIKQLIASGEIKGTVKLYGTPAEETGIGKVYMLRAGYFKKDDVILHWHASDETEVPYRSSKALVNVKFKFKGTSAHASAAPYAGRSALDAVELMSVGVQYMREHIKQDARIHSVITKGGGQPNVVPDDTEAWYYIRANTFGDVMSYYQWVKQIAESAAAMTQTKLAEVEVQSETHDLLMPRALNELIYANLAQIGPPTWDKKELDFAAATQKNFKSPFGQDYTKAGIALSTGITPMTDTLGEGIASTDVGDVSWFVPTGGFTVTAVGYGLPMHSWPVVASTGTSIGTKALVVASKTIAATAIDLYTDAEAMQRVKNDFKKIRDPLTWQTAIPDGQSAPVAVR